MPTSSNKKIVTLLILPLIFGAVRSASLHTRQLETCKPTELESKIKQFYCTSDSLRKLSKSMVNGHHAVAFPAEHENDTVNPENINLALQQFNFTCKIFTNAMAIKHQLQYSLFNGTYFINESGILLKATGDKDIKNFISVLEHLETLTAILQDIEKNIMNEQCIVFSSNQYMRIYWSLINGDKISVLNTLQKVRWATVREYPMTWSTCEPIEISNSCSR